MIGVALKGLLGRKLRATLTAVAIVLGIAMVSGTYVLTDTIKAGFSGLFTTVYENADAVISGKSAIGGGNQGGPGLAPSFPASVLTRVRALPDVADAGGNVAYPTLLVGQNGKVLAAHAGGIGFGIDPKRADNKLNPLKLVSGAWPQHDGQIAIDSATAGKQHFAVGGQVGAVAGGAARTYRIVGIVRLGAASIGGTTLAVFDLTTGRRIFHKEGKLDAIYVSAKPGVQSSKLLGEIRKVLPPTAEVRSGTAQAKKDTENTSTFTSIISDFLLAFAGIALFVGSFVIANTLSITIAQRTREFATLRTLGATRRQVLGSVIVEALVIGFLASLVGLFAGLGLAKLLNLMFVHLLKIDLPQAGTVFATRTIVVSLVLGTLVTLLASLRPALRATHVQPIAAVREGALLPPGRFARLGLPFALATTALAVALLLFGGFANGATTKQRLLAIGAGVLLIFVGVAMTAPRLVRPLASRLGAPGARFGGAPGRLARQNAMRSPARTAATASALMIGLALVTVVAVLAAGLKTRFETSVNALFKADYALTSQNGFIPTGIDSANALVHVPGVTAVAPVRAGEARVFGKRVPVTGTDAQIRKVITIKLAAGSLTAPFVSKDYAKKHHLHVGSPLSLETPSGGVLRVVVRGIVDPPKGGSPFADVTIPKALFDRAYPNPTNLFSFINVRGGVTDGNTARLEAALKPYPDAKLQTESQFKKNQERGIDLLLNLLYVLLSLSIVVSLFGIVNTLVLTVFERTRELGMLRAVGMTRRQVRNMIRHESVVTALIGAALGIPIGIGLGALVGRAITYPAFTVPWVTIVVFVVAAVVAGLIAAIFPARRAARLNVLEALQYE